MEWTVDFAADVSSEDVPLMRETLEAKLAADSGQHAEAARMLWELLVQVRHAKQKRWECITMIHLGKVYKALRWRTAVQLFEEAVDLSEEIGFCKATMIALGELAQLETTWGRHTEALALIARALPLVEPDELECRRALLIEQIKAHEALDELEACRGLLAEVLHLDDALEHPDTAQDRAHMQRIRVALGHERR